MNINKLIQELISLEVRFGHDVRVLVNHSKAAKPQFIEADDDCPAYISIESEA